MSKFVLLGPQRLAPTVREALEPLVEDGPVAAITAGWEEREAEDLELGEHLDRDVRNLELYRRSEDMFQRDQELSAAMRRRHDRLTELQDIYRVRLGYLAPAVAELLAREGSEKILEPEREAAFDNLRALDAHHLERIDELNLEFLDKWKLGEREQVARHRDEIHQLMAESQAVCIAGGHVGILFNRLWLFDVLGQKPDATPVVAWSAGAMAIAERIVLFHDSPPQGKGHAEVLGPGIGACKGVVPLPHASKRLHLSEHLRVQLLSRRFQDDICAALDEETQLIWDGQFWTAGRTTKQLAHTGELVPIGVGTNYKTEGER